MSLKSISIKPKEKEPAGLFVCLHGWGSNSEDLASLAPELGLPDYQFICPDAPFPHPYIPEGFMWYDLDSKDYDGLPESREILRDWLLSLESLTGISLAKTILCGFSQGGAMTLDVGLTLPLGGLIVLSGYLHAPLETNLDVLPPVLLVHGRQDMVVPIASASRSKSALLSLGVKLIYQEFDMGHQITSPVIDAIKIFAQDCIKIDQ